MLISIPLIPTPTRPTGESAHSRRGSNRTIAIGAGCSDRVSATGTTATARRIAASAKGADGSVPTPRRNWPAVIET